MLLLNLDKLAESLYKMTDKCLSDTCHIWCITHILVTLRCLCLAGRIDNDMIIANNNLPSVVSPSKHDYIQHRELLFHCINLYLNLVYLLFCYYFSYLSKEKLSQQTPVSGMLSSYSSRAPCWCLSLILCNVLPQI